MLSVGTNLLSQSDTLKKVKVDYLYHSLRNPRPEIKSMINQLRIIRDIDAKQYSLLKRKLPYIVCGTFNPPFRRTENFAYTEYFIIDIDHINDKGIDLPSLRQKIEADNRVLMSFLSPGEDGLKILFRLKERCYDSGIYSLFYKTFSKTFATQFSLEQVIDSKTSDVCRACFISIDSTTHYNPLAEPVDISTYLPTDDISAMHNLSHTIEKEEKEHTEKVTSKDKDPDSETLNRIKSLLNPKQATKEKPEPYVPERLDSIMQELKTFIEETGVTLYDIKNIQYGKKLHFKAGNKLAEINLFYGKRGFTVVQTPRCGTSTELNDLMAQLITNYIHSIT